MIDYDYKIERDESDEIRTYEPDKIPTQLENLVYIEGPNSSGKSTLLHIIALACGGLKKHNLNPALKEKLLELMNANHQKLTFNVEIENKIIDLKLTGKKGNQNNQEIEIREIVNEKNKPIDPENFQRKYNLIYDIPDNPTDRLKQLIHEIKIMQQTLGNKVGFFRAYILNVIQEIRTSKDPKKIDELNSTLERYKEELETLNQEHNEKKNFLENLCKFTYTQYISDYSDELKKLLELKAKAEKEKQKKARQDNKITKAQRSLIQKITEKIIELEAIFTEVTPILKKLVPNNAKNHLKLWENINIKEEIYHPEIYNDLKPESEYLKCILKKYLSEENKFNEANIFMELKELLEHYQESDVIIPGLEKSIPEFIKIISEKIDSYETVIIKQENIRNLIENFERICELRDNLVMHDLPKYKALTSQKSEITETIEFLGDEGENNLVLKGKIDKCTHKYQFYRTECAKFGIGVEHASDVYETLLDEIDIDPFNAYTEDQLIEKIKSAEKECVRNAEKIKKKEKASDRLKEDIKRLEKMEPHKYQLHLPEIELSLSTVQKLEQKLKKTYELYINNIIDKKQSQKESKVEENKYNSLVSEFLAKKVGYIRHIDEDYKVKKIDIVNGDIITTTGKIIKLGDLGTGQGQSAYLKGLLNTNDKRKIIALFDEVAMMDNKSLEPIYDKLKSLYEAGNLVCGIIVQKADDVKIQSKL